MADSFQLKAIITAVDKVSAPLKGMQRQLKGFKRSLPACYWAQRVPEPQYWGRWRSRSNLPLPLNQKWRMSGKWWMVWIRRKRLRQ